MEQNIPDKYRYRNFEKPDSEIFNEDFEGWPMYKQNIRDFLIGFGLSYNKETNNWEISEDDPRLNTVVRIFEDDGMGYGTNQKYAHECKCFNNEQNEYFCNVFVDVDVFVDVEIKKE